MSLLGVPIAVELAPDAPRLTVIAYFLLFIIRQISYAPANLTAPAQTKLYIFFKSCVKKLERFTNLRSNYKKLHWQPAMTQLLQPNRTGEANPPQISTQAHHGFPLRVRYDNEVPTGRLIWYFPRIFLCSVRPGLFSRHFCPVWQISMQPFLFLTFYNLEGIRPGWKGLCQVGEIGYSVRPGLYTHSVV